jgi:3-methyl-2-oxobutanoate hydroxymethyltransferase
MFTIPDFVRSKSEGRRIALLTCYDAPTAALLDAAGIDAVLVGDSAAMVVHGLDSTLPASVEMIATHVRAVRAGATGLCVIADMPFLSTRRGSAAAVDAAGSFMGAGANAVKIEGLRGHEELIPHLIDSGIPVMGHLGLTPQSVHVLGGYRVQGRSSDGAQRIRAEARRLERLGCFAVVLECVPAPLAETISKDLAIPTIGIGAGPGTDGQILVLHDMLGVSDRETPRFVRRYADLGAVVRDAVAAYAADVRSGAFPSAAESYGAAPAAIATLHGVARKESA